MSNVARGITVSNTQAIRGCALMLAALANIAVPRAHAQAASTGSARSAQPRSPSPSGGATATPRAAVPLSGTLEPAATRALSGEAPARDESIARGIAPSRLGPGQIGSVGFGRYLPLGVNDAPAYGRGSSTLVIAPVSPAQVSAPAFYPTTEPPVWHIVPEEHPVQAWRLVDVEDTICDPAGQCSRVKTRLQARWVPMLGGYAFRDRIGRVWRVE